MGAKLSSTGKNADSKQDQVPLVTSDQSEIRAVIGEDSKQDEVCPAEVQFVTSDQSEIRAVIDEASKNDKVLRIVLLGKTGAGKSASANTILGSEAFVSRIALISVTSSCEVASGEIPIIEVSVGDEASDGVVYGHVSVVDTPGLFETSGGEVETRKKIRSCIRLAAPGPHAFLVVIKLDRFTDEEQRAVEIIQREFGLKAIEYTMVLFTNGDGLDGKSVEDLLKECSILQSLVSKCKGYHVFNNKNKEDRSQVNELLEKITKMVSDNGGSHYTNEMFQEAAREMKIDRQRQRQLKDKSEELLGTPTRTAIGAGSVLGGAIGGAIGGAEIGALSGSVAGGIGTAVGGAVGLAIGIGYFIYRRNKNRNPSEEYEQIGDSD